MIQGLSFLTIQKVQWILLGIIDDHFPLSLNAIHAMLKILAAASGQINPSKLTTCSYCLAAIPNRIHQQVLPTKVWSHLDKSIR
jgi:hypothetical protein